MKKNFLKRILERIKEYWDQSEYFLLMLDECNEDDGDFIDRLYSEILHNIREIESKDQLQKISDELKKIKEKELVDEWKDQEDIEELENLISIIS